MRSRRELTERAMKLAVEYKERNFIKEEVELFDDPGAKEVWWPVFWRFIHWRAEWVEDGSWFFVGFLKWILPCSDCSEHYEEEFEKTYEPGAERAIDIHNKINILNWKEVYVV